LSGTFRKAAYHELKITNLQEMDMSLIQDNTNDIEWRKLSRTALEPLLQSRARILGADDALPIKLRKTHQLLLYAMTMLPGETDISCEDNIGSGRITEL